MRLIDADKAEPYFYEHLSDNGIAGAQNALKEMPTVEAAPVIHAHWCTDEYKDVYCSHCEEYALFEPCETWDADVQVAYSNYCPHCGAVMDELDAVPELIRCKDCKHFELDVFSENYPHLIVGHCMCKKWGGGNQTKQDGFCFLAERKEV